jgi:hypothetical protein
MLCTDIIKLKRLDRIFEDCDKKKTIMVGGGLREDSNNYFWQNILIVIGYFAISRLSMPNGV